MTSELISRTALLNDLSYCAPELWQDEEYIKSKIMKQHAVDAVPVEWLEEMKHWAADDGDNECVLVIAYLLDRWQKEQEAQDGGIQRCN